MPDENGATPAPPPAEPAEAAAVPAADRAMAVIGAVIGLLIIGIAFDLWTGGGLSRLLPVREPSDDG